MPQLQDYQMRVIEEKSELDDKIYKLKAFIGSDKSSEIDLVEFNLLIDQYKVMLEYSSILNKRINLIF